MCRAQKMCTARGCCRVKRGVVGSLRGLDVYSKALSPQQIKIISQTDSLSIGWGGGLDVDWGRLFTGW